MADPAAAAPAVEHLDREDLPLAARRAALAGLARVHRWTLAATVLRRSLAGPLAAAGPRPRVADIGAGDGALSARVLTRHHPGASLLLVDRQLAHLVEARRAGRGRWHVVADGRRLPLADGGVDLAFSHLVWHHLDAAGNRAVAGQLRRAGRLGGLVVDLAPSSLARRGFPLLAGLLRLDRWSREDGVVSLAAAWPPERVLACLPRARTARLRRRFPFRWSLELPPDGRFS